MAETPALPLEKSWEVDPAVTQANIAFALQGRPGALAAAAPAPVITPEDLPAVTAKPVRAREMTADELERRERKNQVILDDAAPGFQESLPQPNLQTAPLVDPNLPDAVMPKPETPVLPDAPYPNPTTTPPEMVQPPADPANPYELK
jgi:hypothetical protein